MRDLIHQVETHVKQLYLAVPYNNHHWDHTERVRSNCHRIYKSEGGDYRVLIVAALFHDVGHTVTSNRCHAELSAEMASDFLHCESPHLRDAVVHAIEVHRFSKGLSPKTHEARVLQDADRLDALGISGMLRATSHLPLRPFFGASGSVWEHLEKKLFLLPNQMHTQTARDLAAVRLQSMNQIIEQLRQEYATE